MKQQMWVYPILLLVAGLQSLVYSRNISPPMGEYKHLANYEAKSQVHNGTTGSNSLSESSTITSRKVNLAAPETSGKNINNLRVNTIHRLDSIENGIPTHPKEKLGAKPDSADLSNSVGANKERDYTRFPPYQGSTSARYQRQRRSSHIPSLEQFLSDVRLEAELRANANFALPDELEFDLNKNADREALMEFMASLRAKNSPTLVTVEQQPLVKNVLADFNEDDEFPNELDHYSRKQHPFGFEFADNNQRPSDQISLINSAAGVNLPHHHRNQQSNSFLDSPALIPSAYDSYDTNVLPIGIRNDEDTPVDDNWLDEAVALQSHPKTRRAGNPVAMSMGFSSSPIKSHFRMLRSLRKPNYGATSREMYLTSEPGYFGSFYPVPARRLMQKRQVYNM